MKRDALKVVPMRDRFPFKDSPQALTLENEIKRIAAEREESIEKTIRLLATFSGISERQIYNYRSGKCDIPVGHIPVFCQQFKSNALAMTILLQCEECEPLESYDIVRLANQSARVTLEAHNEFLEAFDDGTIDSFERSKLKKAKARAIATFNRLGEVADAHYQRGAAV